MTRRNPKKNPTKGRVFDDSETESLMTPSIEPKMVEEQENVDKVDLVDPIVEEKMKYLQLYGKARGELRAYLPSWNSALGQSRAFLKGVNDKSIKFPQRRQIHDVKLNYAPADSVLFEMLKQAKYLATSH